MLDAASHDNPSSDRQREGASMTITTSDSTTTETQDRIAIVELIGRLVLLLDSRDWSGLRQLFTDPVYSDRTSLLGGEPVTLGAAEFVDGWRQTLQNMDAVHHLITCHVIDLDGDEATCAANMMGTHVLANATGGPIWTVGGRHDYQLRRTADGWRIAGLTFTIQWASGNQYIVALAAGAGGQS
jgi:ketosteroid isomerase-like protein